jgi:ketosteroid isomerase-like protein
MSPSNVDVVLDQFAGVNERDFARVMDGYAEDVVLVVHPEAFLNAGTFEGREAVGKWFGDWFRTFEADYRFDIEQARDLGDVVFLDASHHGHGRTSGAEVHGRTGYLYTVRDSKVARVEIFASASDALAAAT